MSTDDWRIRGCPINGPAIAAERGRVAVAWFTAGGGAPEVRVAFSSDSGASFARPIRVDDSNPAGRVGLVLTADGAAWVSWLQRAAGGGELRVRRIGEDGSRGRSIRIAGSSRSAVVGFPQMARAGRDVVFAWTESGTVRTAIARIDD